MNRSNKLRILATALFLVLICSACNHKPVTTVTPPDQPVQVSFGDQVIADAKTYGPVVEASLEEGIKQEALYATMKDADGNPIPPSAIEPQIRQWLIDAKKTVANFNAKAATWDHFDPNKRDDIDKFVRDALAFVVDLFNERQSIANKLVYVVAFVGIEVVPRRCFGIEISYRLLCIDQPLPNLRLDSLRDDRIAVGVLHRRIEGFLLYSFFERSLDDRSIGLRIGDYLISERNLDRLIRRSNRRYWFVITGRTNQNEKKSGCEYAKFV